MEISYWQAALLGLIQGLTEFIPVSSSAHLNIAHWLLGQPRNLTFDVMLNVGTLFALIVYFWKDWMGLLFDPEMVKLRNLIFLACVPAVVVGVLVRDSQNAILFADVRFNALMLIVMGGFLWWADHVGRKRRDWDMPTGRMPWLSAVRRLWRWYRAFRVRGRPSPRVCSAVSTAKQRRDFPF